METVHVGFAHQRNGYSVALGTGGTADAVHIVLGVMGHIIVDDHADIVDIDATGHDIRGHQHILLTSLEGIHHLVALLLAQVAVHLAATDMLFGQFAVDVLYLVFLAGEEDDTLQLVGLEQMLDDAHLLGLMADIGRLLNLLRGFAHRNLHLYGVLK